MEASNATILPRNFAVRLGIERNAGHRKVSLRKKKRSLREKKMSLSIGGGCNEEEGIEDKKAWG